ncbi:hypothetical protein M2283_008346 [Streptomyces pseudovenezuelae]|uniref:Uncharacterized protein n=1 Tax=Streptomyces pseudovenezuelae TaxID=67350 RepID=A0ABT6LXH2_9ACTN|nr:hypothetical protein [Streptomyces pseudovenezuelae]
MPLGRSRRHVLDIPRPPNSEGIPKGSGPRLSTATADPRGKRRHQGRVRHRRPLPRRRSATACPPRFPMLPRRSTARTLEHDASPITSRRQITPGGRSSPRRSHPHPRGADNGQCRRFGARHRPHRRPRVRAGNVRWRGPNRNPGDHLLRRRGGEPAFRPCRRAAGHHTARTLRIGEDRLEVGVRVSGGGAVRAAMYCSGMPDATGCFRRHCLPRRSCLLPAEPCRVVCLRDRAALPHGAHVSVGGRRASGRRASPSRYTGFWRRRPMRTN